MILLLWDVEKTEDLFPSVTVVSHLIKGWFSEPLLDCSHIQSLSRAEPLNKGTELTMCSPLPHGVSPRFWGPRTSTDSWCLFELT